MPEYTRLFELVDECTTHELEQLENAENLTKAKQHRLKMLRFSQYNHELQQLRSEQYDEFNDMFHDKHHWLPPDAQTSYDKRHQRHVMTT